MPHANCNCFLCKNSTLETEMMVSELMSKVAFDNHDRKNPELDAAKRLKAEMARYTAEFYQRMDQEALHGW